MTATEKTMDLRVSEREFHSILAALRTRAAVLYADPIPTHDIDDIASCGGEVEPLDVEEIGDLCVRLNTADYGYDRLVTLSKGGEAEQTVPLKDVTIWNAWHLAQGLRQLAERLETLDDDQKAELLDLVGNSINMTSDMMAFDSKGVLEVWHMAHDFKRELAGDRR